jgi:hypothetical protein
VPTDEKDRYFAVPIEVGNSYNFGFIGSRATGNDGGDFTVVRADRQGEAPKGIKKMFRSST